jgi:energy-coupling factor transporter ATP-binding protein EcfA2
MFDQQPICPYTGLRSFTEEESLYFKGRDLQIDQVTALLEKNRFLMLTGASGEGKSSLIYAGLVPNARAGFFKAKYSNWVIADFRPERSPVTNLADAIGTKFDINPSTAETELRRGYSSLIDLYTNSDFYIDEESDQWENASDDAKKEKKRSAANLLIIADQFEEFFTNPENYYDEVPSQDSQIVVNLLLETAKIALLKNIPVYVVCTMRSDYIGQCSAFRGLADYIGFSQFFVPRLKRKDLKQVIEEPALLSGNRISQRLVERLVYDLSEGVDQLPILQHALSQIWRAASDGSEEMDLIHYAMVGGMPANELPEDDQKRFLKWYKERPEYQRNYFKETGLHRVIEIHADTLYENAWDYYIAKNPNVQISRYQAKQIIAAVFSCLTKIDNSRAVRNRMTLEEITDIIHTPGIKPEVTGSLINIFREEGNSFIRPFKTDDPQTHNLSPESVLDITHESLIRNWQRLKNWADQEYELYSTYLDFKKQLDRWKASNKSSSFLLPVGPLSYFENWYQKCRPGASWIRRYSEIEEDKAVELEKAETILSDIREFLKRSARKVAIPRAFMKYGPKKIATSFAILLMISLSIYYWIDAEQKQNERVIETVRAQSFGLLKSNEVNTAVKAEYLLTEERYEPGALVRYLSNIDSRSSLPLAIESYKLLLMIDKYDKSELKAKLLDIIRDAYRNQLLRNPDYPFLLAEINKLTTLLAYDNYYNPDFRVRDMLRANANEGYEMAMRFFRDPGLYRSSIPVELNYAIQQWLTFGTPSAEQSRQMLQLISPYEGEGDQSVFGIYYPRGSYELNGRTTINFNGGYHTLASLYASAGDSENVIRSFDEIRLSGQDDYFIGSLFNNYNHILAIFYQFGHRDKTGPVVQWLGEQYESNTPLTIYRNSVIRAGYMNHFYTANIDNTILRAYGGYFFPNLTLSNRTVFNALADDYEALIREIRDPNERNYSLAINKKRRAMFGHKYAFERGFDPDLDRLNRYLDEAVTHFRNVDDTFLAESIPVTIPYLGEGVRNRQFQRRELFIYPDYLEGWFSRTFHTDLFFNYIDANNLFEEFYTTSAELDMVHFWLAKAYENKPDMLYEKFDNKYPLSDRVLNRILALKDTHPHGTAFDYHLPALVLANKAFDTGDINSALDYYSWFDKQNFHSSRDRYEYLETTFFMNQMKDLGIKMALAGFHDEAVEIAELFERNHEKVYSYTFMAEQLYMKQRDPIAFVYLDSALTNASRVNFSQFDFGVNTQIDVRFNLILLLSRIGGKDLNNISNEILREIVEGSKFQGISSKVYGVAEEGNLYRAKSAIPTFMTEFQELWLNSIILWQSAIARETEEERVRWAKYDRYYTFDLNYVFYSPN